MRILSFITCILVNTAHGQNQLEPIISVNYSYFRSSGMLYTHELQIGGGVQFNDYFSLQLNLRGAQNIVGRDEIDPEIESFRIITLSISPAYRVLASRFILSPVISFDMGTELGSNAKGKLVDNGFYIRPEYNPSMVLYDRGLFFGKGKLLLDIKLKSFDILLGGSYNLYAFRVKNLSPIWYYYDSGFYIAGYDIVGEETRYERGFGLEGGVMYTFPTKKKKEILPE